MEEQPHDKSLCKTLSLKTAAWALYCNADIVSVEPVQDGAIKQFLFTLRLAPGTRSAPVEGEMVELTRYVRAYERAKSALTSAVKGGKRS